MTKPAMLLNVRAYVQRRRVWSWRALAPISTFLGREGWRRIVEKKRVERDKRGWEMEWGHSEKGIRWGRRLRWWSIEGDGGVRRALWRRREARRRGVADLVAMFEFDGL
ncbi:hypothetical protein Ancab_001878 [Ancistrocladus abbreviatus]